MGAVYPEIEPYERGMLDVGAGHRLYWEVCGNPAGKPAVVLHGGPGSGCTPGTRRYFDPDAYRIVLFDQRNCGRSRPHASEPDVDLSSNDTEHQLADIEALRQHLGVERWLVRGGSWGAVLALAYAQRHPDRVSELVLMGLATGRRAETDLLTRGLGRLFPAAFARFRDGVPPADRDADLADAYHRLLFDADPAVRAKAARDWCDWEIASVPTATVPSPRYDDPDFRLCFARIVTHYFRAGSWLDEGTLLRGAGRLAGIPGVLVQGTLDLGNLLGTPWLLAQAWPGSDLVMIDDVGHDGGDAMSEALVDATDRFAGRVAR
ncbi:MAG: proline iminopeptidase [Mycobacteriales bacterium]